MYAVTQVTCLNFNDDNTVLLNKGEVCVFISVVTHLLRHKNMWWNVLTQHGTGYLWKEDVERV